MVMPSLSAMDRSISESSVAETLSRPDLPGTLATTFHRFPTRNLSEIVTGAGRRARRRLVEEEHLGVRDELEAHVDALALAAGDAALELVACEGA